MAEFVVGTPLSHEMAGGRVHPRRAMEIATQIADALAEAHARGLIHGDIRPDTIFVTQKGSAKLLDFGMSRWTRGGAVRARAARAPDTLTPEALSTVAYLSPEQALGGLVDIRTDVFSLGVLLYEMLTGENPFRRPTVEATVVAIISTVITSRWLPGSRPCSLPETIIGVAPAITCESPFLLIR